MRSWLARFVSTLASNLENNSAFTMESKPFAISSTAMTCAVVLRVASILRAACTTCKPAWNPN